MKNVSRLKIHEECLTIEYFQSHLVILESSFVIFRYLALHDGFSIGETTRVAAANKVVGARPYHQ